MHTPYLDTFLQTYGESLPHDWHPLRPILIIGLATVIYYIVREARKRPWSLRTMGEYVVPMHLFRHPSQKVDRWVFVHSMFLWRPLIAAMTAVAVAWIGTGVSDFLNARLGHRPQMLHSTFWILAMQGCVFLFFRELTTYVVHRAQHEIPFLWATHKPHHSAESLTFFTDARAHPLESVTNVAEVSFVTGIIGGLLAFITGTPINSATIGTLGTIEFVLFGLTGALAHTHVPINYGKFNRLIMSPVMHQIHHSAELRHRDKNFTIGLGIFDWMFGTLYIPEKDEVYRWGLNEEEIGAKNPHLTLKEFYLAPFREWREMLRKRRR